jgi:hypothetical protein
MRREEVGRERVQWREDHDEGWTEPVDVRPPRHVVALAQLIAGALIATVIIVYLVS